jgi:3D (Asp-Asp-Asp) domain-containing protein
MKHLFIIAGLLFTLTGQAPAVEQTLLARITVYWKGESGAHASWNGARLQTGHCSVDPKKIPYGSTVIFPDAACLAVDTGTDIVNRRAARVCGRTASQRSALVIDRYFDSKQEALSWARQHPVFMTVRVQPPESRQARAARLQTAAKIEPPKIAETMATLALQLPRQPWSELFGVQLFPRSLWEWGFEACSLLPAS